MLLAYFLSTFSYTAGCNRLIYTPNSFCFVQPSARAITYARLYSCASWLVLHLLNFSRVSVTVWCLTLTAFLFFFGLLLLRGGGGGLSIYYPTFCSFPYLPVRKCSCFYFSAQDYAVHFYFKQLSVRYSLNYFVFKSLLIQRCFLDSLDFSPSSLDKDASAACLISTVIPLH